MAYLSLSREASADSSLRPQVEDAWNRFRQARMEYASTPRGFNELQSMAGRSGDPSLQEDIRRGRQLRDRNNEIQLRVRESAALGHLRGVAAERVDQTMFGHDNPWMHEIETRVLSARFYAFLAAAQGDESLVAPKPHRHGLTQVGRSAGLSGLGREVGYALWRAQVSGVEFAPAPPQGCEYRPLVTPVDGLQPGDVIDEPGTESPTDVEHEGKVVARVQRRDRDWVRIEFTDGSQITRTVSSSVQAQRLVDVDLPAARARFAAVQGSIAAYDRDLTGRFVVTRDGERVYAPRTMDGDPASTRQREYAVA